MQTRTTRSPTTSGRAGPRRATRSASSTWKSAKDSRPGSSTAMKSGSPAVGASFARDSSKLPFLDSMEMGLDWVHEGAFDPQARLRLMDEIGVHAQVLFPNVVGLGGSTLNNMIPDLALRIMCLQIYNDAMAEMMEASGKPLHSDDPDAGLGRQPLH